MYVCIYIYIYIYKYIYIYRLTCRKAGSASAAGIGAPAGSTARGTRQSCALEERIECAVETETSETCERRGGFVN